VERNPGFRPEYKGTFKNTVVISHQQELQYPKDLHFLFALQSYQTLLNADRDAFYEVIAEDKFKEPR